MEPEYIEKAMARARVEHLDGGLFYAHIPALLGCWASSRESKEDALAELRSVLGGYIEVSQNLGLSLPKL